jgi:hypothetical protein
MSVLFDPGSNMPLFSADSRERGSSGIKPSPVNPGSGKQHRTSADGLVFRLYGGITEKVNAATP